MVIVQIVNVHHIFLVRSRENGRGKAFIFRQRPNSGTHDHIRTWPPFRCSGLWKRIKCIDKRLVFGDILKIETFHGVRRGGAKTDVKKGAQRWEM
jgi:hypothetical protein